jgi:hypothetical protein
MTPFGEIHDKGDGRFASGLRWWYVLSRISDRNRETGLRTLEWGSGWGHVSYFVLIDVHVTSIDEEFRIFPVGRGGGVRNIRLDRSIHRWCWKTAGHTNLHWSHVLFWCVRW